MATARTAIQWTDSSWNPTRGCSLVSPGCTNCYAMKQAHRFAGKGQPYEGLTRMTAHGPVWTGKMRFVEGALDQPLRWRTPRRIFVNSMSDLFHEDAPDEWIDDVFAVMALAPRHTFQVLTKRAERMRDYMAPGRFAKHVGLVASRIALERRMRGLPGGGVDCSWPLKNVWLGVSIENQETADARIPWLLDTPAAFRWVSYEPALGPVDFSSIKTGDWAYGHVDVLSGHLCGNEPEPEEGGPVERGPHALDWIVVGGESGPGARPMPPQWARSVRDQCQAAGVPFFFKQWGEHGAGAVNMTTGAPAFPHFTTHLDWVHKASSRVNGGICVDRVGNVLRNGADFARARDADRFPVVVMHKLGKKRAGRLLDGREWNEFP